MLTDALDVLTDADNEEVMMRRMVTMLLLVLYDEAHLYP